MVGVALVALASGFGQFGIVAALGDVARGFGHVVGGTSVADQAGLSGTRLGLGLAVIRLASLGALPVAGLADRYGRRRTLLATCAGGLALTVLAATSPGYWWFVVIFALGRPLLSATNALAGVSAAEQTGSGDRTRAMALVAAGYAAGAGLAAVLHGVIAALGFRGLFALAALPLAGLALLRSWVTEPDRFALSAGAGDHARPVVGAVAAPYRARLVVVGLLAFAVSVVTGPANSYVFLYGQDVLHRSGPVLAAMVVAAGVIGLPGLLLGRALADRLGRRPTCAGAVLAMAGGGILMYSGSVAAFFAGYLLGVLAGSVFAPGAGALLNELFPTAVRASVSGWQVAAGVLGAATGLVVFGALADAGRWGVAAGITFAPAAVSALLYLLLPETRGREPEDLWPTPALSRAEPRPGDAVPGAGS